MEDGGTKAGLQAELMPLAPLLGKVRIQLGQQVARVYDGRGQGQPSRALELFAPWAGWLGQQPEHKTQNLVLYDGCELLRQRYDYLC